MRHIHEDYNRIQDQAGNISKDEPVFLLRAQDKFVAQTLRYWANLVRAQPPDRTPDRVKLADLAREQAKAMDDWPVSKVPDLPQPEPPTPPQEEQYRDFDFSGGVSAEVKGCWVPARPEPYRSLRTQLKEAWLVFREG